MNFYHPATNTRSYQSAANSATRFSAGNSFYLTDNRSLIQRKEVNDMSAGDGIQPKYDNSLSVNTSAYGTMQFVRGKEKRPGFRSNVKRMRKHALQVLNGKQFDMAHRMSYSDIADIVLDDTTPPERIKALIRDLTIPKRNFGKVKMGDKAYYNIAMSVRSKPKMLLKILNSSPYNLRPGDPSTNRGIGARGDLHYNQAKPKLKRTLTPQSSALKKWIREDRGESSDFMSAQQFNAFEGGLHQIQIKNFLGGTKV